MSDGKLTERALDELVSQNVAMGSAIVNYRDTGDITYIDKLTVIQNERGVHGLVYACILEWEQSPSSIAVMEAVAHRIATRDQSVYDQLSSLLALQCVTKSSAEKAMDRKLLDHIKERGCSDFSLALFWIFTKSMANDQLFGWYRFGYSHALIGNAAHYFGRADELVASDAFEEHLLEISDADMLRLFQQYSNAPQLYGEIMWLVGPLQALVARGRPDVIGEFLKNGGTSVGAIDWRHVVGATDVFDEACFKICQEHNNFEALTVLDELRGGKYKDRIIPLCQQHSCQSCHFALDYLAEKAPELMLVKLAECIGVEDFLNDEYDQTYKFCQIAAERWDEGGAAVFKQFDYKLLFDQSTRKRDLYTPLFHEAVAVAMQNSGVAQWIKDVLCGGPDPIDKQSDFYTRWVHVVNKVPSVLESELWTLLQHRLKAARALAVAGLQHNSIADPTLSASKLLSAKSADARLGGLELLHAIGSEQAVAAIAAASKEKQVAKVKREMLKSLEVLGYLQPEQNEVVEKGLQDILSDIEKKKSIKLPKSASWVDFSKLPELPVKDGSVLSEKVFMHMVVVQSKHKSIALNPEIMALYDQIDRSKSAGFAIAILNQWLATSQSTTDRWVLTLAGFLGDSSILPLLSHPIKGWAEAARHKLAEYAAQAVALVQADESLMILDTLANRYRSRFRNIGKACQAALEQAAVSQGVSMDELADMIVPTLDFDEEFQRVLSGTEIRAVLQADFKLSFFNPSTESETKSPPSSLPETATDEIKTIRKLIREIVKGQTARLEQSLVRQRAWPTKRWQELFEVNPFLRSYASRLVWTTLDEKGGTRQLFRRYPNGLLANASGEIVEFDEADKSIVMVHPLNLDEPVLNDWRKHLLRMKIKPPFAQLDRPTAVLDTKLANRKKISATDEHKMSCGTFRSRAERLGWVRGSVTDGGGISSYYKDFPGALVTVFLMIEFMYVGQDPMEEVSLSHTVFVKADSVKIGSYLYDEPSKSDDPRVLAFGDVPPVVYSETLSDIQIIVAKAA